MKEHERPSRPVLFFTKESDYPYWGRGSSFFITSGSNIYWITAQHVIENQKASPKDLMITPGNESTVSVPFDNLFKIKKSDENEDFRDLFMLRVNLDEFWESKDSDIYAWNINRDFFDSEKLSPGDELFLLGYPSESRYVDYDVKRIHFTRVVLRGLYQNPAHDDHCHVLKLETSVSINDLDGLSGGVVFRYPQNPEEPVQVVGLMIRGSVERGNVHFVGSNVIREFVHIAEIA
jgi:hypothetical protein